MTALHKLYHPLTASPFAYSSTCKEHAPAQDLEPYIRCYWTSAPYAQREETGTLVIPDTCVDLIFRIDEAGRIRGRFCAIQDGAFISAAGAGQRSRLFAIRFYPWAAALFAQESLRDTRSGSFEAGIHFPVIVKQVESMLQQTQRFEERCAQADGILRACRGASALDAAWMNAMHTMLKSCGSAKVSALAQAACLSARQLERLFIRNIGVGPKSLSSMVRYQYLWRDAAGNPRFDVQDAVQRYGYTDQAHLLRQFKAYHSLPLTQAIAYARGKDVAFLQYNGPEP